MRIQPMYTALAAPTSSGYSSNMSEQKSLLREQARQHREITDIRGEDIEAATPLFFETIQPQENQIIAAYWPKGREFDPTHILETALIQNFTCALPKVDKANKILKFVKWDQSIDLVKGEYGIMEPVDGEIVEPDIFLVPFLSFDRKGYRLGQGGGYYDATLAHYRAMKDITAIGIGYAHQAVLFTLPVEKHDEKMDYILTPQGITDYRD